MAVTYDNGIYVGQMSEEEMLRNDMAEALERYESGQRAAREAMPVSLNQGVYERAPVPESEMSALRQELFAPLQLQAMLMAGGRRSPIPNRIVSTGMGELTMVDPLSGSARVIKQARPGTAGQRRLSDIDRITLQDLLSQRRAIAGKKYLLSGDHQRLSELDQQIAAFQSGIADQADSQQSLEEPGGIPPEAFGERLPIGYIGGKGQPNRMVWPEPAARIKVRSPSGKLGSIPESQLDEALRSGYSRVQ